MHDSFTRYSVRSSRREIQKERRTRCIEWGLIGAAVVVIAAFIVAVKLLPTDEWLRAMQVYVKGLGAVGWIVYALVYALCCVLFVPASLLTLGAGVIFGLVEGTIVVVIGATLGPSDYMGPGGQE